MIGTLLLVLLGVGGLILPPLQKTGAQQPRKTIEGTWILVSAERGGQKLPDEGLKGTRLILNDGHYTCEKDRGTYKVIRGQGLISPNGMDITGTEGPNKGKTLLAIYELEGDTLTICYDLQGKQRPEEFATLGSNQFLATYKRAKE
ncbi:MAG TPA: TIGR03067 domain-containing protein [Blastocatellia bacterium]